jgi:hypothetical protein
MTVRTLPKTDGSVYFLRDRQILFTCMLYSAHPARLEREAGRTLNRDALAKSLYTLAFLKLSGRRGCCICVCTYISTAAAAAFEDIGGGRA